MRGSLYREGVSSRIGGSSLRNRCFTRGLGGGAGVLAGLALAVLFYILLELGLVGKVLLLLTFRGLLQFGLLAGLLLRGLGGSLLRVAGIEGIPAGFAGGYTLGTFAFGFGALLRTDFGLGEGLRSEGIGAGQGVGKGHRISERQRVCGCFDKLSNRLKAVGQCCQRIGESQ